MLAGNAHLAINGGRIDALACAFGAWTVLAALVQLALLRRYRRLVFAPGVWAFAFSYAASAGYALYWIEQTRPPGAPVLAALVLTVVTSLVATIALRTAAGLWRRTFLPAHPAHRSAHTPGEPQNGSDMRSAGPRNRRMAPQCGR